MTLEELKAEIMLRARDVQICDEFQNIQLATSYAEILEAGKKFPKWVWIYNIMDPALIVEFPTIDLENAGIYTGIYSLTGVVGEVYVIEGAVVDFVNSSNEKLKIMNLGGLISIIANDNAYVNIENNFEATSTIISNDNAVICIHLNDHSTANITANNESTFSVIINNTSTVILKGKDNSFINVKLNDESTLDYTLAGSSQIKITSKSTTTVNGTPL